MTAGHSHLPPGRVKRCARRRKCPNGPGKGRKHSISLSDDEDDDEVDNEDADDSLVIHRTPVAKKKKNLVNRSPSITPPPPVPMQQLMVARNLVRQTFDATRSSPPIIDVDDDDGPGDESVELAPELVAIAVSKRHAKSASAKNGSTESSTAPQVTLTIKFIPHPKDEEGEIQIFQFNMRQDEAFASLFSALADEAGVLEEKMIVTYDGKRVFATSTPFSLGVWSAAEFEAYNAHVFEYIQERKRERAFSPNTYEPEVENTAIGGNLTEDFGAADSGLESDGGSQDTFKLTLQSGTGNVTVTVRPATKCSSIVASFLKKTGRPASASKKARICVDGESLDPNDPIDVAGLEDGDVVDIIGI
ncbi:hypothetical protein SCHPADRAFT_600469 [Schizopora paradoxa]|uniref:Rad60/SUMO-like domain-containing protein n=1 Tax=Schizopora paradoxa TaxID=27342 RepID=A0A0H2RV32_9AGAM|nr:hypothetical protein SCHPADRAFT_600469 [Schizopora paradoxa]